MVLAEFLVPDGMMYADEVRGWREAVDIAARPLMRCGAVRRGYVDAIKDSIDAPGGTYIDLGKGVALAHARPETGVVRTSLSVLHVSTPFPLAGDEAHPITTMFCLGAVDADAHLELMRALACFLTDAGRLDALARVRDVEGLRKALS